MPLSPRQQRIPVNRPEQRPDGHRAHFGSLLPQPDRALIRVGKPAQLFFTCAAVMDFGDGDRQPISLPNLAQAGDASCGDIVARNADRLDIGIGMQSVAAPIRRRITLLTLVQKPVGCQVIVEPDDIGRGRCLGQLAQDPFRYSSIEKSTKPRMMPVDTPAQQIETEPSSVVLVIRLGA